MRRIVITADDYGLHPDVSALVIDLLARGAISATTMLVASPHAPDAAQQYRASGLPTERLRLHFALNSPIGGPAWYPVGGPYRTLTDDRGAFFEQEADTEARADAAEVAAELRAQFEWLVGRGLRPGGIDVHRHIVYGLFGRSFLPEVLAFCAGEGLPFRLPRDPALQYGEEFAEQFGPLLAGHLATADRLGVPVPRIIASLPPGADAGYSSYQQVLDRYLSILEQVPDEGTSEVFLHPVPSTEHGPQTHVWEAQLLQDPAFHEALAGFEVVGSWR